MRTYALENRGGMPLYEYLYRCIRGDILDGTLTAGERLPSKRALAEHLHISVMTVEGAYQQLEAEGYVYTQPKRGFFVAEVERPRPAVPAPPAPEAPPEAPVWRLDLKSNQVDASRFPAAAWARLTRQVLSEDGEALLRPVPHQGLPALRQAIARDLREYKGMAVPPEQIVVGAGAEYLYLLLAQLLGREAVFAVEDPGYPKIRQVYGKCGAACRPVPLDGQGVPPEALAPALARCASALRTSSIPSGPDNAPPRRPLSVRRGIRWAGPPPEKPAGPLPSALREQWWSPAEAAAGCGISRTSIRPPGPEPAAHPDSSGPAPASASAAAPSGRAPAAGSPAAAPLWVPPPAVPTAARTPSAPGSPPGAPAGTGQENSGRAPTCSPPGRTRGGPGRAPSGSAPSPAGPGRSAPPSFGRP